jgi:tetratricopeptide (TPR) repeat protein
VNEIEQIEKYLAGTLSGEELQAFNIRLQTDPSFAETMKLYSQIETEMSRDDEEIQFRENLSPFSKKYFNDRQEAKIIPVGYPKNRWWMYAAAVAAGLALMFIFKPWQQQKILNNEEVFAKYAVAEDLPVAVRGSNADSLKNKAGRLFNNAGYAAAIPLLDSLVRQNPGESQLFLSLGICFLNTGQYAPAIAVFDNLAAGQSSYKYDALFWKALAFLKQDNKTASLDVLKQIPREASNYKKAGELIGQLSK